MVMDINKPVDAAGLIIEAWAQGFMVGALIIMTCVAVANMKKHVMLHKLIIAEVSLAREILARIVYLSFVLSIKSFVRLRDLS